MNGGWIIQERELEAGHSLNKASKKIDARFQGCAQVKGCEAASEKLRDGFAFGQGTYVIFGALLQKENTGKVRLMRK